MLCHNTLSNIINFFELWSHSHLLPVLEFAAYRSGFTNRTLLTWQRGRVVGHFVLHTHRRSSCFRRRKCLLAWVAHSYCWKIILGRVIVVVLKATLFCFRSDFIDRVKSIRYTLNGLFVHLHFQNLLQLLVLHDLSPWLWQDAAILHRSLLLDAILPVLSLWLLGHFRSPFQELECFFFSFLHHHLLNIN